MPDGHEQTVSEALAAWRAAERDSIHSAAQREAAEQAVTATELADDAARRTAHATTAAVTAASEAADAAAMTADAATKLLQVARSERESRELVEREAREVESSRKADHGAAVARADARYGRRSPTLAGDRHPHASADRDTGEA